MYSYGQFAKTPIGRMRVRKMKLFTCMNCSNKENNETCIWCRENIPHNAYLEKPSIGGKDHTSN